MRFGGADIQHVADGLMGVDRLEVQLHFVLGDPGEIEEVVDELAFEFDVAPHHGESGVDFRRRLPLGFQSVECREHRSERRAQLVRKHGEKIVLGPVRCFDSGALLLECGLGPAALAHPGSQRDRGDGGQDVETLEDQERLILIRPNERSKAVQRSPNGDGSEDKKAGGSLTR